MNQSVFSGIDRPIFCTKRHKRFILPGFRTSLILTLLWVGVLVILPITALIMASFHNGFSTFYTLFTSSRILSALALSFGTAFCAAWICVLLGTILAWALARNQHMPGLHILDVIVDLPFALPTAIAGITMATLYGPHGWIGHILSKFHIHVIFTPIGIILALVFVGLPFVVRTMEPALKSLPVEIEETAATLGASHGQIIRHVILPSLMPSFITAFSLAFARGVGEYGSVIFIAGNLPHYTEVLSLLIVIHLERFDYTGAAAIGVITLGFSFTCFLLIAIYRQRFITSNEPAAWKIVKPESEHAHEH
ncbi:sulfate ABC transporter permease subunit CysT [Entomobacter blattae]|uniref:Sulfate transport system permease protein CysT n=1 Tax=Entomobacter blattae TaxID=2762277 RepID=A0A7H1NTV6_9PROT|nr:sulfate ABC transporter permease subunit CysT [Entomobacter blattae]QNT79216.1 Binding-protein-dependent transport system inner membrane component [Entomobacter blattae]